MSEQKPIWPNDFKVPLIIVSGAIGSGKTKFALQIDPRPPGQEPNALLFDLEHGSDNYAKQYAVNRVDLHAMVEAQSPVPQGARRYVWMFKKWLEMAYEEGSKGTYTVMIIDPADYIAQGAFETVNANLSEYGLGTTDPKKVPELAWAKAKSMLGEKLLQLMSLYQTIVVIAHQRNKFNNRERNAPKEKEARVLDKFSELASFHFHLYRDPHQKIRIGGVEYEACPKYPVPMAIVLKQRLDVVNFTALDEDGNPTIRPLLPARIPSCTPGALRKIMLEPQFVASPEQAMPEEIPGVVDIQDELERAALKVQVETEADHLKMQQEKNQLFLELVGEGKHFPDAMAVLAHINHLGYTDYAAMREALGSEAAMATLRKDPALPIVEPPIEIVSSNPFASQLPDHLKPAAPTPEPEAVTEPTLSKSEVAEPAPKQPKMGIPKATRAKSVHPDMAHER